MSRLATCLESGAAFVLYRLPGQSVMLIDTLPQALPQTKSFLFLPFRRGEEVGFRIENGSLSILNTEDLSGNRLILSGEPGPGSPEKDSTEEKSKAKIEHIHLIYRSLEEIRANSLLKVVLARKERRLLPPGFDAISFFQRLCAKYPTAFVYLTRLYDGTIWTGASPEILVQSQAGNCTTVALAGTRSLKDERPWTAKEMREQSIVSDYIREKLQRTGLAEMKEEGPFEAEAGNLRHLKTVFRFQTDISPEMLALTLHPTPAVAGIPVERAIEFIQLHEQHSRSYYAGCIGPYDAQNADFFVNLRCASLFHNTMDLYAGGGIVEGSDPDAEYEETLHKMQTLWSVVENS